MIHVIPLVYDALDLRGVWMIMYDRLDTLYATRR